MPPPAGPAAPPPVRAALVMLAAGDGRRLGHHTNKVLLPLAGRGVFTWSLRWARLLPTITRTVLVIRESDREAVNRTLDREVDGPPVEVVVGGTTRHGSEWEALKLLAPAIEAGDIDVVVVHDAARPLAGTGLFDLVIETAARSGCAIPASEQAQIATLRAGDPPPDRVVAVQTPQAFTARPLLDAYRRAHADGFVGTDTASCMERYTDEAVHCVPGDAGNIKITFPEDLFLAERLLAKAHWDLSDGQAQRNRHGFSLPHRAATEAHR